MSNINELISFIRNEFKTDQFIPLHAPYFGGNEKKYVTETIDSTFVSSVGAFVNRFEDMMKEITGAKYAIATVNGTTALHLSLLMAGVQRDELVITQSLTFVATANAIAHVGATPVFVDVDLDTMGLSPDALSDYLKENAVIRDGQAYHKSSGQRFAAIMPMHTFGHPVRIEQIVEEANTYHIPVVEDAAESLGSYVGSTHTGNFGLVSAFSFNGNKTVTCGGGGALITNNDAIGIRAKHVSTTAKIPHPYEFFHDEIGFNYRMPNLNAALACAQLEQLEEILRGKRVLAEKYIQYFEGSDITFKKEPERTTSNYWLNAVQLENLEKRNEFLKATNDAGVMTRPIWTLMNKLPMFEKCERDALTNSIWLEERIVNLPSSYILRIDNK